MNSSVWIASGIVLTATLAAGLTAVCMEEPLKGPTGESRDAQKLVSAKAGHAILLCTIETTNAVRALRVAKCIRPFEGDARSDWKTISLPPLSEKMKGCQGAIVFVEPEDKIISVVTYIYDGKVSLLRTGEAL